MSPTISIALSTYNGQRFLRQQLDSIYAQTISPAQVVAVDDCSTDGTVALLEEYVERHGLKLYLNTTNQGCIQTTSRALSLCTGDYIALSDQDDIWFPEKLETLHYHLGDKTLVCSDSLLCDERGNLLGNSHRRRSLVPIPKNGASPDTLYRSLLYMNFVTGCTALFRRSLLDRALPIPPESRMHDWWLALWATQEQGIVYYEEPLQYYRQHDNNIVGAQSFPFGTLQYLFSNQRKQDLFADVKRFQCYLEKELYATAEQKMYLEETLAEYRALVAHQRWEAFSIAWQHREYSMPTLPSLIRLGYLATRLLP